VGTLVILDATPAPNSVFVGWTGACTGVGPCTVTMDDSRQVTATFRGPQVLDVTVTGVEGGYGGVNVAPPNTVCTSAPGAAQTCTSLHAPGTMVTLDALPGAESVFVGWSGACTNLTGPCLVSMDMARSVTANFRGPQALVVTLSSTLGGSGTVQVDPPGQACTLFGQTSVQCAYLERVGTVVTLTAQPAFDSLFLGWGGACSGSGACTVSVAEATAVTATFRLANRAPVAIAGGPYTAPRGVAVEFDGRGSSDPDGDALTYRWDFGDGSTGTGATPSHSYAALGPYVATLIVNDGALDSAPATAAVTIANRPERPSTSTRRTPPTPTATRSRSRGRSAMGRRAREPTRATSTLRTATTRPRSKSATARTSLPRPRPSTSRTTSRLRARAAPTPASRTWPSRSTARGPPTATATR
jgi:hypothetical protein